MEQTRQPASGAGPRAVKEPVGATQKGGGRRTLTCFVLSVACHMSTSEVTSLASIQRRERW